LKLGIFMNFPFGPSGTPSGKMQSFSTTCHGEKTPTYHGTGHPSLRD